MRCSAELCRIYEIPDPGSIFPLSPLLQGIKSIDWAVRSRQTTSSAFPFDAAAETSVSFRLCRNSITLVESDRLYWRGNHGKHFQIDVRRTAGTLPPLRSALSLPLNTSRSDFTNYDLQVFCSICCSYSFIRIDQTVFSGDQVGKVILNESICSVQRLTALSLLGFSKIHLFPFVLKQVRFPLYASSD